MFCPFCGGKVEKIDVEAWDNYTQPILAIEDEWGLEHRGELEEFICLECEKSFFIET